MPFFPAEMCGTLRPAWATQQVQGQPENPVLKKKKQINNSICFKISVSNCFLAECVQCTVSIVSSAPSCPVLVPISQMKTVCLTDSESKAEMTE